MPGLMTAEELFEWVNGKRGELVRGEFIEMSPTDGTHGRLTNRISVVVGGFIINQDLGEAFGAETGFILSRDPDTVRAPDFAFIAKERLSQIGEFDRYLPIPPDLAVEVISPNDRWVDVEAKVYDYLRAGVRMVWLFDPTTQTVHVYEGFSRVKVLTTEDELDGGEVVPGFRMPVREFFK
ncbi:MAG: Uma2 family endonuclease [Calditrichaeota bacterium]|nr:MAG: Uma2 family endonuclease [Calditrichota bacterium]